MIELYEGDYTGLTEFYPYCIFKDDKYYDVEGLVYFEN